MADEPYHIWYLYEGDFERVADVEGFTRRRDMLWTVRRLPFRAVRVEDDDIWVDVGHEGAKMAS